ncbi:MAG: hypothetical protein MK239_05050, partial [Gemmatimonadetes bacterium]|nr:hypothetical protein [Gemmatimonadota bacterium]
MTQKGSDTPIPDQATSRRLFFKFLAASPLAALAYSAAPSNWLEPLSGAEPSVGSAPVRCAGCGVELPPLYAPTDDPSLSGLVPQEMPQELPPQEAQEEQLTGTLISSPEEAINVWDFERVTHDNNLAQHWDYLHMGVDDYETRVPNSEG